MLNWLDFKCLFALVIILLIEIYDQNRAALKTTNEDASHLFIIIIKVLVPQQY